MPLLLDHLVICVRDLPAAQHSFRSLGFTLTPPADHPFGTRNSLALMQGTFIELLTVGDAGAIPAHSPDRFSFGAHNQAFLARGEGLSMISFRGDDARADARRFAASGLGTYEPLDFGRDAVLPDGGTARFGFSLAFATDPSLPDLAFFTCQQRHPPELFWRPAYQTHANGAVRVVEVILCAAVPEAHRTFLERLTESTVTVEDGCLAVGPPSDRVTVLSPERMTRRYPECAAEPTRFRAARMAVADLDAAGRLLRSHGVPHRVDGGVLVIPPAVAHGIAVEFVSQGVE